jgi:hypothetical protein
MRPVPIVIALVVSLIPALVGSASSALTGSASAASGSEQTPLPAFLLDPASDRVLARTVVPDATRKVGEVRLIARGEATVVQTLLATKVLSRVVAEIRRKEERNWPADAAGYRDMRRYLDALEAAAADLRTRRDGAGTDARGDRRLRLMIEFVASETASGVLFAAFDATEVDGAMQPTSRQPITALALGRAYVFPNTRLILADAFKIPESEVGRLGPLGPLARPAGSPPS